MSNFIKNEGPKWLITFVTLIMIIVFFINNPIATTINNTATTWGAIIISWLVFIVIGQLTIYHANRVRKESGTRRYFSAILIFLIYAMALVAAVGDYISPQVGALYASFNANVYGVLSTTIYALVGFFMMSAVFRGFRARSFEAWGFLIFNLIMQWYWMPTGVGLFPGITNVGNWIGTYIVPAGYRTFVMVLALGAIATGIRRVLQFER